MTDPPATPPARRARRSQGRSPASRREAIRENVLFWVKAILVILLLRAFIFEPYRIPSESMEDTLLVGDFLIVSKLHYGARTPETIGLPLTQIYVPGLRLPQTRLPGFSSPQRGDVAVFNYPADRDVVRGAIPDALPAERRAPYIKRLVGMPGDTLAVLDKVLHINGQPQPLGPTMKQRWRVVSPGADRPTARALEELGVSYIPGSDVRRADGTIATPRQYDVVARADQARALEARPDVARVVPFVYPEGAELLLDHIGTWNPDQYGPVVVPGRGVTVALDRQTGPLYAETIRRHEGRRVAALSDSTFAIDGQPAGTYTFAQDYYFAMGDNRDNSVDGRAWGFVPEDHLIGKAVFNFMSWRSLVPPVPRLERFFRPIR
ncbi:MAG: signal peptidase I [Rubricoccaceae bacterium]